MPKATSTKVPVSAAASASIPTVTIRLPMAEDPGDGARVDQNEYVTINGHTTMVPRGQTVNVSVPVFMQLRSRYPEL